MDKNNIVLTTTAHSPLKIDLTMKLMYTCKGTRLCRNRFMIRNGHKGAVYFFKGVHGAPITKKLNITRQELDAVLPQFIAQHKKAVEARSKKRATVMYDAEPTICAKVNTAAAAKTCQPTIKTAALPTSAPAPSKAAPPVLLTSLYQANLQHKKCLEYFKKGYAPSIIALLMHIDEHTVQRILRAQRNIDANNYAASMSDE